jgi:hypothetical protein
MTQKKSPTRAKNRTGSAEKSNFAPFQLRSGYIFRYASEKIHWVWAD